MCIRDRNWAVRGTVSTNATIKGALDHVVCAGGAMAVRGKVSGALCTVFALPIVGSGTGVVADDGTATDVLA
eukprot:5023889-Prymnesium_polylepis.1